MSHSPEMIDLELADKMRERRREQAEYAELVRAYRELEALMKTASEAVRRTENDIMQSMLSYDLKKIAVGTETATVYKPSCSTTWHISFESVRIIKESP